MVEDRPGLVPVGLQPRSSLWKLEAKAAQISEIAIGGY